MQVGGGGGGGEAADLRGRHRIQAELKKLEQEARFLEEELEELEKTDKVSSALQDNNGKKSRPSTASNHWACKSVLG